MGERVLHDQEVSPVDPSQAGVLSLRLSLNAQHLEKHLVHRRPSVNVCAPSDWNESGTGPAEGAEVTSGGSPELESGAVLTGGSASRGPALREQRLGQGRRDRCLQHDEEAQRALGTCGAEARTTRWG